MALVENNVSRAVFICQCVFSRRRVEGGKAAAREVV